MNLARTRWSEYLAQPELSLARREGMLSFALTCGLSSSAP
jgi:hypothetical protein